VDDSAPGLRVHAAAAELAPPRALQATPPMLAPVVPHAVAAARTLALTLEPVPAAMLSAPAAILPAPAAMMPEPPPPHAAPIVVRAAARRPTQPHAIALVDIDVEGSLSRAVVERAIARVMPELHACTAPSYEVAARFTVDDSRRATDLHVASASDVRVAGPRCITDALARVRTEVAPDIGDATVSLRFR